ncbi:MAG: transposase [Candidatus Nanopelagicales bacterium]|nr:transposase [Candidatus Nanopelagicales bacterium]MDZ4250445.1 transposase [Candidatus Nanopelagicales bacterium]MDZ7578334.1 transposase [Candidatus Nanopelagicales bacterium]
MATKRYQYRVRGSLAPEQGIAVAKTFGCARVVFNDVIHAREEAFKNGEAFPKSGDLSKQLITQAKHTPEREWLSEPSAVVLQQALADADRAYRNYFQSLSGRRKGPKVGKPRYKSKRDRRQSVRFTRNARFKVRHVSAKRALLTLPGIPGELPLAYSRPLPGEPSSVTLIQEPDGTLFVSCVVDAPAREPLPRVDRHAAGDLGLTDLVAVVASDGTRYKVPNPRTLRKAERDLARKQKALSRKEKGSNNREKARVEVACAHRKVRNRRLDHAHKLALTLIRENQTVSMEALRVRGLARAGAKGKRGRGLRKSVHDAGWGQILRLLVVGVPPPEGEGERQASTVGRSRSWTPPIPARRAASAECWTGRNRCQFGSGSVARAARSWIVTTTPLFACWSPQGMRRL